MASRPCFRPALKGVGARTVWSPEFQWHPGFSLAQKQRCIAALHGAIRQLDPQTKILEISSKSQQEDGVQLSAFNLKLELGGVKGTVESFFQGSKVFDGAMAPSRISIRASRKRSRRPRRSSRRRSAGTCRRLIFRKVLKPGGTMAPPVKRRRSSA